MRANESKIGVAFLRGWLVSEVVVVVEAVLVNDHSLLFL